MNVHVLIWLTSGLRGNHPHCQLPQEQYGIVEDFIDRFLLGKKAK